MEAILPISKSWAIRMIFLDMLYGGSSNYSVIRSLEKERDILANDIKCALDCAKTYINSETIYDVRDSGTVCRFLIYLLDGQKYRLKKGIQLAKRKILSPRNISQMSIEKLLSLGSTQYASAALLKGVKPIKSLPQKCQLSLEARKTYFQNKGKWIPKKDEAITRQIKHFQKGGKFVPQLAEDYCYARAFDLITKEQGQKKWPELENHECNRLIVMEEALKDLNKSVDVHDDHRVVMAIALKQKSLGLPVRVNNKKCVAKSWPEFWEWLRSQS